MWEVSPAPWRRGRPSRPPARHDASVPSTAHSPADPSRSPRSSHRVRTAHRPGTGSAHETAAARRSAHHPARTACHRPTAGMSIRQQSEEISNWQPSRRGAPGGQSVEATSGRAFSTTPGAPGWVNHTKGSLPPAEQRRELFEVTQFSTRIRVNCVCWRRCWMLARPPQAGATSAGPWRGSPRSRDVGSGWSTPWPGWTSCCTASAGACRSPPARPPSATRRRSPHGRTSSGLS
jgi:hypothetical protein